MRRSFGPISAVAITGVLFGLQHLSALATTARTVDDVLLNIVVSACFGIGLAAFQYRFRWVLPLVLVHSAADFTTILSANPLPDAVVAVTCVAFLGIAALILRQVVTRGPATGVVASADEPDGKTARIHDRERHP